MRALRLLLGLLGLVWFSSACKQPSGSPVDGQIVGQVYTNDFFRMSVGIPSGWATSGLKPNLPSVPPAKVSARERNAHQLLLISEKPMGSSTNSNPSLLIMAEKASTVPGVRTAKDYVARVSQLLADAPIAYRPLAGITETKLGKVPAFRLDFSARLEKGRTARQSYIVCLRRGYVVSLILSGRSATELEQLERMLPTVAME